MMFSKDQSAFSMLGKTPEKNCEKAQDTKREQEVKVDKLE
jgi:hypothetical protein